MSVGQDRSYAKQTIVKMRVIDSVGEQVTTTTHNVTAGGDAFVCDKETGVTPEVGDYLITYTNIGWATEAAAQTHVTAADFATDGWRPVRGGRN